MSSKKKSKCQKFQTSLRNYQKNVCKQNKGSHHESQGMYDTFHQEKWHHF